MAKLSMGICAGHSSKFGCAGGPFSYPEDIDENDNYLPVPLDGGYCDGCIEARADAEAEYAANSFDMYDR